MAGQLEQTAFGQLWWAWRYWSKTTEPQQHFWEDPLEEFGSLTASNIIRDRLKLGNFYALAWAVKSLAPGLQELGPGRLVAIPPSVQGLGDWPGAKIAKRLPRVVPGNAYEQCLTRGLPIFPQHLGGPRKFEIQVGSMVCQPGELGGHYILVDDVATTLTALTAAAEVLTRERRPDKISALVVGRHFPAQGA